MDTPPFDPWRKEPEQPPEPTPIDTPEPLPSIVCWRCGKDVSAETPRCPYCRAPLTDDAVVVVPQHPSLDPNARALTRLLGFFAAMLAISVIGGLIQHAMALSMPNRLPSQRDMLAFTVTLELIDTVLVLAAWAWIGMKHPEPSQSVARQVTVWMLALPMLALALLLNIGYHRLLQKQFGVAPDPIAFAHGKLLTAWVLAICLQPAVIEELFFRYLMFGGLRKVMGGNTVVWITAVMFAAAHIYQPMSLPVLFVLGILLGYARFLSGSIVLPMFLHFLHNAVVMALNSGRF